MNRARFSSARATLPADLLMRPIRVVYIWDADYPWDVRTEKICLSLTQAGHEVHIVARNRAWNSPTERRPEGLVHRMRPWKPLGQALDGILGFPAFFSPRWRAHVRNTASVAHADLLIVRDVPLCPTALAVGRRLGIPVILDMAEHYPAIMRELWTSGRNRPLDAIIRNPRAVEQVERYCIKRADHILTTVEESSARLISMGVPEERLTVVGNTPSSSRTALAKRAEGELAALGAPAIDVVYLGLLEVSRGINELIEACAMLSKSSCRVRLVIIGDGRDEKIFRLRAQEANLTDDLVVFHGYVPYEQAMDLVAAADIGVLPIHVNEHMNTTIPNKLFDYMSVGIPVITSDSIPSARLVVDTGCGEVFRARDAHDLAAAIVRLSNSDVRARKGAAGRNAVLSRYNWEHDSAALLKTIEEVAAARPHG